MFGIQEGNRYIAYPIWIWEMWWNSACALKTIVLISGGWMSTYMLLHITDHALSLCTYGSHKPMWYQTISWRINPIISFMCQAILELYHEVVITRLIKGMYLVLIFQYKKEHLSLCSLTLNRTPAVAIGCYVGFACGAFNDSNLLCFRINVHIINRPHFTRGRRKGDVHYISSVPAIYITITMTSREHHMVSNEQ